MDTLKIPQGYPLVFKHVNGTSPLDGSFNHKSRQCGVFSAKERRRRLSRLRRLWRLGLSLLNLWAMGHRLPQEEYILSIEDGKTICKSILAGIYISLTMFF
jgi:hypothetical protein